MSRPYINVNGASFSSNTLTVNYSYYKLRNPNPSNRTLTIDGFSSSLSFTSSHDNVDYSSGRTSETLTFTINNLGTASSTTYTPASVTYVFSGTPSTTSNLTTTINGLTVSSATSSVGGVTSSLTTFLSAFVNSFTFSGANNNMSAILIGTNSVVFTAPTYSGTYYNNLATFIKGGLGTALGATLTYSISGKTFSGGVNTYNATMSFGNLGYGDGFQFTTTGTNI